jgi:hypothetical protein
MNKISIAQNNDPYECAASLGSAGSGTPKMVVFFASSKQDMKAASEALQERFPGTEILGCSTAGEIVSGSMPTGSIVAMSIPDRYVESVATAYVADPANPREVAAACASLEASLNRSLRDLDHAAFVGVVLVDGLSGAEEKLMDKLGDLTDIPFVGGSAADDLAFTRTLLSLNGATHSRGAILAVLHVPGGYRIVKAQSFQGTGKRLTATSVDEAARTVREFDGQPAAAAYAAALGVPVAELPGKFMNHPLGLMISGEPFVRSPQRVDNSSVVFYCNVKEGTELEVLESTDIVADTKAALAAQGVNRDTAGGVIDFHCILRTLELRANNRCEDYGRLFADVPTIGFSTYGEEYMGHINQTSTMLVFPGAN